MNADLTGCCAAVLGGSLKDGKVAPVFSAASKFTVAAAAEKMTQICYPASIAVDPRDDGFAFPVVGLADPATEPRQPRTGTLSRARNNTSLDGHLCKVALLLDEDTCPYVLRYRCLLQSAARCAGMPRVCA